MRYLNPLIGSLLRAIFVSANFVRALLSRLRRKTFNPAPPAGCVALDPSSPPLEALFQSVVSANAAVVGLVGVDHDNGVSTIARALARRACDGGKKVLLVDASFTASADAHFPEEEMAGVGYSRVSLRPTSEQTLRMRDITVLRKSLTSWLERHDMVIVDMPPPLPDPKYPLPATVLAKACDATLLVCLTGRVTHTELESAASVLRAVGAPLLGVIVNHREQPTLGAEMAREAERVKRVAPALISRPQARVSNSKFLNVHA